MVNHDTGEHDKHNNYLQLPAYFVSMLKAKPNAKPNVNSIIIFFVLMLK